MDNVEPALIITDNDPAMSSSIKDILPNTIHLVCQWHMQKHLITHFACLSIKNRELRDKLVNLPFFDDVYEFDEAIEYCSDNNLPSVVNYLNLINSYREKWSLAYRSSIFHANISTKSRAESMNSILKSTLKSTSEFSEIFFFFKDSRIHIH